MTQNQIGEFQIPNGAHHPDSQVLATNEVSDMYSEIYESQESNNSQEIVKNDDIVRLYQIGNEIAAARKIKLETKSFTPEDHTSGIVRAFAKKLFNPDFIKFKSYTEKDLITRESQIGAEIFNNRPAGEHIQFFNLDPNHWYFFQETEKKSGTIDSNTIHYEIQESGVLKICDKTGIRGEYLQGDEYQYFIAATDAYFEQVMPRIYGHTVDHKVINLHKHDDITDKTAA